MFSILDVILLVGPIVVVKMIVSACVGMVLEGLKVN